MLMKSFSYKTLWERAKKFTTEKLVTPSSRFAVSSLDTPSTIWAEIALTVVTIPGLFLVPQQRQ